MQLTGMTPSNLGRAVAMLQTCRNMRWAWPGQLAGSGVIQPPASLPAHLLAASSNYLAMARSAIWSSAQPQADSARLEASGGSRHQYPTDPRVGVGVVILRKAQDDHMQVLLAKRAKPPGIGLWAFPGGSQEVGETLQECAVRESFEETGLHLRNDDTGNKDDEVWSPNLRKPTSFAAANVIDRDALGQVRFHYTVVEVAAVPHDNSAEPLAAGDVDAVQWMPVKGLRQMAGLADGCARVAEQAVSTFQL